MKQLFIQKKDNINLEDEKYNLLLRAQNNTLLALSKALKVQVGDLEFKLGAELEFYILDKNNKKITIDSHKIIEIFNKLNNKYFDLNIDTIEEEDGFNQFEVQFNTTNDAVSLANNIVRFRKILATMCDVDFSAKPFINDAGSSLHFHISVYYKGINLFSKDNPRDDSEYHYLPLYWSIAGMLDTILPAMRIFAPTENCYYRYLYPKQQKHIHYPTGICWGFNNRTCAIRIPKKPTEDPDNCRIEHRVCSSMSDPFLDLFAILYGMEIGFKNKMECPEPIYGNAFDIFNDNIIPLPKNIETANKLFEEGCFSRLITFL